MIGEAGGTVWLLFRSAAERKCVRWNVLCENLLVDIPLPGEGLAFGTTQF